jgi:hypothetical protein
MCCIKAKAQASAKKDTTDKIQQWEKEKAEKQKAFASASKKNDKDDDFYKKAFTTSLMESYATVQNNKQKKENLVIRKILYSDSAHIFSDLKSGGS